MKTVFRAGQLSCALLASVALGAVPANALTINLHDVGGVTGSPAAQGFAIAAHYWESVLTNTATVNIDVGYAPLGPGILGSTGSNLGITSFSTYFSALAATGTSALDATAVAHLPNLSGTGSVQMIVPGYINDAAHAGIDVTKSRIAPDGMPISQDVALSTANIKAFTGGGSGTDAGITFSSNFAFDFNPADGITPGTYDFIGVAIHEIGHSLGFLSGADDFDYYNGYPGNDVDLAWWAYALDTFRYANEGSGPMIDLAPDRAAYFSVDGGATAYNGANFSTGAFNGDGWQASHWKAPGTCGGLVGIMNPYLCNGTNSIVTGTDLAAFDVIGWNLNPGVRDHSGYARSTAQIYASFVPESATWMQMILGFGLLGAGLRWRKAKAKVSFA